MTLDMPDTEINYEASALIAAFGENPDVRTAPKSGNHWESMSEMLPVKRAYRLFTAETA